METMRFVLLDLDYVTQKGTAVVRLYGKLPDGRSIIAYDRKFKPYIYVLPHDIKECRDDLNQFKPDKIEKVHKKEEGQEKEFLKITFKETRDIFPIRKKIKNLRSVEDIREHDIPLQGRYLIDNDLFPLSVVEVQGRVIRNYPGKTCLFSIENQPKQIKSSLPLLNILSFKIETCNPQGVPRLSEDPIIIISFSSNQGLSRVFTTKNSISDYVETVPSEKELIQKFTETVKSENPDIIIGYNSDKFDFPYLKERAQKYGMKLNLGLDGSPIKFTTSHRKTAYIKGRVHVDLYKIVRRHLQLNSHTLKHVYLELFGEDKIDFPAEEICACWNDDGEKLEKLYRYSLEDTQAMDRISAIMLGLSIELCRLVGQPLFDVTRRGTGYLVEWYLIRKSYEYGYMVPNKFGNYLRDVVGGYVEEPLPGLHENIVYFDFRSLYPSIIIAKNISPDTLTEDGDEETCHIAPEFFYKFKKEPTGFIPLVTKEILNNRFRLKALMKESTDPQKRQILDIRQNALKTLVSTIYGLYNHSTYRWYSIECSESITAWGREFLQKTTEKAEKNGFKVIYADTDGFYAVLD
ncbi:MAG: DNA-directed DNA polymerase [Methanobacterium sp.]|nr:DNA-directed DNA polymerase [Methanobacterium sp.]